MEGYVSCLVESMFRYIGQTVTIFTTSGGLSGNGFTGVLLSADCNVVRLLADIGAYPPILPAHWDHGYPYGVQAFFTIMCKHTAFIIHDSTT